MSSQSSVPEIENIDHHVAEHPNAVIFIKGPYDLKFDPLMASLDDDRRGKRPKVETAWLAKSSAPRYAGHFRISGDHNIVIYRHGTAVKRIIGIPPSDCLNSTVSECMSDKRPAPSPER